MGFMDGFGDAFDASFSSSYKAGLQRYRDEKDAEAKAKVKAEQDKVKRARDKSDTYAKSAVSDFFSEFNAYQDREQEVLANKGIAMDIITSENAPEGALATVWRDLNAGRDQEQIREDIRKRGFVPIQIEESVANADEQSQALGLDGKVTDAETTPVTETGTQPVSSDDLWSRVTATESSNRQTDEEGETLESDKGALGIAQVLPATAMDPGMGVPSIFDVAEGLGKTVVDRDENAARALLADKDVNEAFGRKYLDGMLKRYEGDQEKALIAYNAGPSVADNYDGDRSSLPEETQGYLTKILGASTSSAFQGDVSDPMWNVANLRREMVVKELGITGSMYDQVMAGYTPELPQITMAWGVDPKSEDTPDYMKTSSIRPENYMALAAEAREANDEQRAVFIETLGERMANRGVEPKYINPENYTSRDTVEGFRLAAQHDFDNATTEEEKARAKTGLELTTKWIEDKKERDGTEDPWYYGVTLNEGTYAQHLTRATIEGDMDALKFINGVMRRDSAQIPEALSKGYVGSLYAKMKLMATSPNATEEDIQNWENFKQNELPILMTALRLTDDAPTDLVSAYDAWVQAKAGGDQLEIDQAASRYQSLLNVEADKQIAKGRGDTVRFIKKNPDLSFDVVVGYQTTDPENPGNPRFMSSDGTPLEGYEVHDDAVYKQAQSILTKARTEAKTYRQNRKNVVTALPLYGDIITLVDETPLALTSVAGGVAQIRSLGRELDAASVFIESTLKERGADGQVTLAEMEDELRAQGLLGEGETLQDRASQPIIRGPEFTSEVAQIAQNRSILVSKLLLMTFRAGGLEGQTGNAMSNKDFERLQQMITASSDPEAFKRVLTDYINNSITGVKQEYLAFTGEDFAELQAFRNEHKYDPLNNDAFTMSIERAIEVSVAGDARLATGVKLLEQNTQRYANQPEQVETTGNALADLEAAYSSGQTITVTQEFLDKYPQLIERGVQVGQKIKGGN